jgi:hypothetical protein
MNARTRPTIALVRSLLAGSMMSAENFAAEEPLPPDGILFFQFDDFAHNEISSVAYGTRAGTSGSVRLVPDAYFFQSRGYEATRQAALAGGLPKWDARKPVVFWRGASSYSGGAIDGGPIAKPEHIPRIALCLLLKSLPDADAAVYEAWGAGWIAVEPQNAFLASHGIVRPKVPMLRHADYKFHIDIDGVANAWGFFDKLLMGLCVLKVSSPFQQWFYRWIQPWVHYVPVAADLSDLLEKIEWCRSHDQEAREIGERAQAFALKHTFSDAVAIANESIRAALIAMPN